jgi:Copper amine oxidase, enzyme domain
VYIHCTILLYFHRVTPYKQGENYPGGAYPNQAPAADGLEKWTKQDRTLVDTDVVLWHCFGVHHVPRCVELLRYAYCYYEIKRLRCCCCRISKQCCSVFRCDVKSFALSYTGCTSAYYVLVEVFHDVHVQRCAQVHHVCTVQQYYDDLAPNCVHLCVLEIVVTLVYFL